MLVLEDVVGALAIVSRLAADHQEAGVAEGHRPGAEQAHGQILEGEIESLGQKAMPSSACKISEFVSFQL